MNRIELLKRKCFCKKHESVFFVGLILVLVFSAYPLLNDKIITMQWQDTLFHMSRIEGIVQGITGGQFPVRISPSMVGGFGYATNLFYPDLFLYIPAFLRIAGFSPEISYKTFLLLCIAATYFTVYISVKNISKSRYAALIAAVLVCLSQYYLHNLIYRGALGEVQAYIFMPLVLWGLYDLFAKGYKKPWIMGIGLVGLMNTHIISLFITAITVFVFCLFHCKVFIKNPKLLLRFLLTIGIVLLVTCWFWMPCIEMMRSGAFKYQTPWANPADYALSFVRLIGFSREGIGMPLVCLCLLRLFVPRKPENRDRVKWADCFMITGLVLAFVSTEYFPWDFFNGLFAQIQFPFRVLAIGTIFLAASIGILAGIVFRGKKARAVAFCAMAGISCLFAMNYYTASISKGAYADVPAEYFTTAGQFEVGMGEWLPADSGLPDSNEFEGQATDVVLLDNGTAIPMQRTGVKILFEYLPSDGVLTCDVPLLYYKGYSAVLTNEKGEKKPLELSDKGSNHVIQIRLPHDEEGRIEVNYTGTPLQQGSLAVSLGTLAALGIYAFIKRRRKENNMMAQDAPAKTVQEKL